MYILDEIVEKKISQIEEEKKEKPLEEIIIESQKREVRDFTKALENKKGKLGIIAEIKKASPSKGIIKEDFNLLEAAKLYENSNVDCVSILTEKYYFLGKDEYILEAKKVLNKPILRKDFIVDEYQIYQTKAIGGDGILLIAEVLKEKTKEFYDKSIEIGLHPIVEIHSKEEIEYISGFKPRIIGVNNRDLKTFKTDIKHTEKIKDFLPKDIILISESGIETKEDLDYLEKIKVEGVLIGEHFMRNLDDFKEKFKID